MSPWVRATADAPAEIRVPAAGKAVWVKADGEGSAPPPVVEVSTRSDDEPEPPSTWLVPSFELPPR